MAIYIQYIWLQSNDLCLKSIWIVFLNAFNESFKWDVDVFVSLFGLILVSNLNYCLKHPLKSWINWIYMRIDFCASLSYELCFLFIHLIIRYKWCDFHMPCVCDSKLTQINSKYSKNNTIFQTLIVRLYCTIHCATICITFNYTTISMTCSRYYLN